MKYVLVTGASTGIGYSAVEHLINSGYGVFGSVRKQKDASRLAAGKYFDMYIPNAPMDSFEKHGYVYVMPHIALKVGGKEMSGTSVRAALGSKRRTPESKAKLFQKIFVKE